MRAESLSSSDFLQPHGLEPARILCPWDSPGKNTEVGAMPSSRGSSPMGSNLCLLHLLHCQVDSLPRSLIRCFPGRSDGKESACNAGDLGSIPGLEKSPWRREWLPTPVFLPGEFHGWRSLVGYSPWGRQESDTTEQLRLLTLR